MGGGKVKPITLKQWNKMTPKKRSWIVCRELGEHARVFWHCVRPNGEIVGGSYDSSQYCAGLIDAAQKLTPKYAKEHGMPFPHPMAEAHPVCTASFSGYAEYDHLWAHLGLKILTDRRDFRLCVNGAEITASSGRQKAKAKSIQEAVCLLFLKQRSLIRAARVS